MADHTPRRPIDDVVGSFVARSDHVMVAVSAMADDEVDACIVGFHCQCSIEPLRYAVWLSKANRTERLARRADRLVVHWLDADQRDLARRVGTVTADDDPSKMRRVPFERHDGAAVLTEARRAVVFRIVHVHDDGDHRCYVVEPEEAVERPGGGEPLRFGAVRDLEAGHEA